MDNKIFEKVFERIELCGIDFSLIAKVEIKQILEEIWQDGYNEGFDKGLDKAWEIKREAKP